MVAGTAFPFVTPEPGDQAKGLFVEGLTDHDVARLDFYEGFAEFALRDVAITLADGRRETVPVYFPSPEGLPRGARFDIAEWEAQWGETARIAAREYMDFFGRPEADRADPLYDFFLARADATQRGRASPPPTARRHMAPGDVTVQRGDDGYRGFFRLDPLSVAHRRFDGSMSATFQREIFVAYDAALVLPYDPATDRVLMIEQVRFGPMGRGDPHVSLLEPIAGLVDAGETPEDTARREAREEAGLTLTALHPIMQGYPSPGYSSEYFHCYVAVGALPDSDGHVSGLATENEDIRTHVMSFDRAMALVECGEINALPLTAMLLWLARHREGLRASA
jgi:nudix-type nucleoside diphosphatase (YffH/AdpP family)